VIPPDLPLLGEEEWTWGKKRVATVSAVLAVVTSPARDKRGAVIEKMFWTGKRKAHIQEITDCGYPFCLKPV
jgi:hypothetical protein